MAGVWLTVAFFVSLGVNHAVHQESRKIGIAIDHSGDDRVGMMLVADLKEHVTRSARYRINDAAGSVISLVTLDNSEGEGHSSAVSVQYKTILLCGLDDKDQKITVQQRYTHSVVVVGRSKRRQWRRRFWQALRLLTINRSANLFPSSETRQERHRLPSTSRLARGRSDVDPSRSRRISEHLGPLATNTEYQGREADQDGRANPRGHHQRVHRLLFGKLSLPLQHRPGGSKMWQTECVQ